jgi:hypothetical protein
MHVATFTESVGRQKASAALLKRMEPKEPHNSAEELQAVINMSHQLTQAVLCGIMEVTSGTEKRVGHMAFNVKIEVISRFVSSEWGTC